jgi:hypothetical protein
MASDAFSVEQAVRQDDSPRRHLAHNHGCFAGPMSVTIAPRSRACPTSRSCMIGYKARPRPHVPSSPRRTILLRRITPADGLLLRDVRLRALAIDPLAFGSTYALEAPRDRSAWEAWAREHASGVDKATFLALGDATADAVGLAVCARSQEPPPVWLVLDVGRWRRALSWNRSRARRGRRRLGRGVGRHPLEPVGHADRSADLLRALRLRR